ncbi:uncharacterized protein FIBRA_05931 [Fibroporia radiculosa]|uniref:Uncharacterized protein n=1 Tax=Fibroporia radiculosa TaxID=599839 RepID=J4H3T1_9APHY|nr:uncharacterized protein FIBRA_05931 [Fibroporia radiculosa]CCM03784.1 predicted protein [Fibroporia radiculosa]
MAWAILIFLYSVAGGIFLLELGPYIYFTYPEWQIYGGIGIGVGVVAAINVLALSNVSNLSEEALADPSNVLIRPGLYPLAIVFMDSRLKSEILWECANGQQLWPPSEEAGYGGTTSMPSILCTAGFPTIYVVFIIALLVDLAFQLYMFFMTWRYEKLLQHYQSMQPTIGGYYKA